MDKELELLGYVGTLLRVMLVSELTSPEHQHVIRFNLSDFTALGMLREQQVVRASELAGTLGIVPTTASSVIARLVKRGLVSRTQSETDRRAYDLSLTPEGAQLANAIHNQDLHNMRLFLSALDDEDQTTLLSLLGRVVERVASLENAEASD
ncbi:MarR family transcriptional regulator [uncultured Tateyamaria sp.]|uniref:MarR family winged helix-turn-helix transcriptional regulator n=1 Tax=uncultured Tateyamaria sp. TaxID=455651 RepID=UPI002632F849|nr:MarR family transcriptional regulator [uncultured Tateyamaria sp.]